jgi:heptosyltransferase-3
MNAAVCSCLGLGDGLIALVLSHNLYLHGHKVTTFHPFLSQLQAWFPHLPIQPFPPKIEVFNRYFIIYEKSEWMQAVLKECLERHRTQTTVLNPIATPNTDYAYWEEGRFDGNRPFAENLLFYCRNVLGLSKATKNNGITVPKGVTPHKYPKRVVIHPTSSRPGKNWTREKFLKLAEKLKKEGFEPAFTVSPKERCDWPEAPAFATLADLVTFVCESGYMIGNDSGVGHLASCLGLPTVTLCRNERTANFWRPAWSPGKICLPVPWLPNVKGMRWRDEHWQRGISVRKVLLSFEELCVFGNERADLTRLRKKDVVC